ncbi:MAG: Rid family hydrolase [Pseudohongiellaceae bacterium]
MPKKTVKKEVEAELLEASDALASAENEAIEAGFFDKLSNLSNTSVALIAGVGLAFVIVLVTMASGPGSVPVEALGQSSEPDAPAAMPAASTPNSTAAIERQGEGRHFFTTIKIPPSAATLYLSGSGASQKADGSWGSMEEQTIDTFSKFKQTLVAEGWSMSDIVQVRAFAVAGEYGLLDFEGFNRGYREFFGTEENPQKPVRSFVQVADLVVPGWLVEIEIRAAKI